MLASQPEPHDMSERRLRGALALYPGLVRLAMPVIRMILRRRLDRGKEDPKRLAERLGIPGKQRPPGPLVWLHGASVGEALSALPLIDALLARNPALNMLVTTGTVTSATLLGARLPARAFHQFVPVDLPRAVEGFLDHWRPDAALWLESEFWPNLLAGAAARDVPIILLNARLSPSSFARWRRWPRSAAGLMSLFTVALAQDRDTADRLTALGARDVRMAGNLKHAAAPLPAEDEPLRDLVAAMGARPRWLAASTHDGEELIAAEAHLRLKHDHADLLTLIVPRHPERGSAIAQSLARKGLAVALRSRGDALLPSTDIYIADTIGELGLFYRTADIVFIGGSLVTHGGQNPLEAARLNCAILHGPHTHNFGTLYGDLNDRGAAREVATDRELSATLAALLDDRNAVRALAKSASQFAADADNVLDSVIDLITPYLPQAGGDDARA
jgi:3-deoxy-D-manno-octulosonic-acid transferase